MMLSDLDLRPDKKNWVYLRRDLLSNLGFYDVLLNQGVGNIQLFLSLFKQRITDIFVQNWMERLSNSSRASFYKNTTDFQPKLYLDCVNVLKFRSAMDRLRISSHRLEIEAGRWSRPYKPVNERKCKLCNCLEDNFSFCDRM